MAKPLSQVRFAIRYGGSLTDFSGGTYFDTNFGYIEDWSGILSEGPISGDIIEQDWVDGALWQQGKNKTYSFDVPFTALVPNNTVEPNIWGSYAGINALKAFRGPLLTMRREFLDTTGKVVRQEQAMGVLVTDFPMTVGIGRVIHSVAVFQNLTGSWLEAPAKAATFTEDFTVLSSTVWNIPDTTSFVAIYNQCVINWGTNVTATATLKTRKYFDLTSSAVIMECVSVDDIDESGYIHAVALFDKDTNDYISFRITQTGASLTIRPYTSALGGLGTVETSFDPVAHRWLRIVETNGVLYWYTSPNRTTWTQLGSLTASFLTTFKASQINIGLIITGYHIFAGVANIANINTTVARASLATLTDTFNTPLDYSKWQTNAPASSLYTSGGRCVFTWGPDTASQFLTSKPIFDATASSVYVYVPTVLDFGPHPFPWYPLQLFPEGPDATIEYIGFKIINSSGLKLSAVAFGFAATLPAAVPYVSGGTHSWMRIGISAGTITWSTSPDGTTWTTFATLAVSVLDPTVWVSSAVRVGAGRDTASVSNNMIVRTMELDNFNTPPG